MIGAKALGVLLILAVGAVTAKAGATREREKLTVLDAWLGLLLYLRGQIDCYLLPLDEIFRGADKELLRAASAGREAETWDDLLHASLPHLGKESARLLTALMRELGSSYREEQLRRCDYYLSALEKERDRLAAALPARQKLCVASCLCTALGTAILLW